MILIEKYFTNLILVLTWIQLAIVGDFTKYTSKSLSNFMYESNQQGRVNFVNSIEAAKTQLTK